MIQSYMKILDDIAIRAINKFGVARLLFYGVVFFSLQDAVVSYLRPEVVETGYAQCVHGFESPNRTIVAVTEFVLRREGLIYSHPFNPSTDIIQQIHTIFPGEDGKLQYDPGESPIGLRRFVGELGEVYYTNPDGTGVHIESDGSCSKLSAHK